MTIAEPFKISPALLDLIYNWANDDKNAPEIEISYLYHRGHNLVCVYQGMQRSIYFSVDDDTFGERFYMTESGNLLRADKSPPGGVGWPE